MFPMRRRPSSHLLLVVLGATGLNIFLYTDVTVDGFFSTNDCPCVPTIFRPPPSCPTMVCATGYYSSCYSQCQCSRRRRREASHRSEGPLQNRNSIPQHTTRSQLTAHAKCNNDQLERIMVAAVRASSGDPTVAKASILEGSETLFNGPLAVACGESKLSYTTIASHYCSVTRQNMSCYAFFAPSKKRRAVVEDEGSAYE